MSTIQAAAIIFRAQTQLHDPEGVRWSAVELVDHLNVAQKELVRLRPDQMAITQTVALTAGYRHFIPDVATALVDIPANATGRKRRITKVDLLTLDNISPDWRSSVGTAEVVHFVHDMREPRVFLTYPPAATGASVEMTYGTAPVDLPVPTGPTSAFVTGTVALRQHWSDALLNFVMGKAYMKDAEFGGNAQLAVAYMGMFNAAVGSQLQATATVAPQT